VVDRGATVEAAKLEASRRLKWSHYLMNRSQRSKKKEEKQHHYLQCVLYVGVVSTAA